MRKSAAKAGRLGASLQCRSLYVAQCWHLPCLAMMRVCESTRQLAPTATANRIKCRARTRAIDSGSQRVNAMRDTRRFCQKEKKKKKWEAELPSSSSNTHICRALNCELQPDAERMQHVIITMPRFAHSTACLAGRRPQAIITASGQRLCFRLFVRNFASVGNGRRDRRDSSHNAASACNLQRSFSLST